MNDADHNHFLLKAFMLILCSKFYSMKNLLPSLLIIGALGAFTISKKPTRLYGVASTLYHARDTVRVELESTTFKDMSVLYINDTATSTEAIKNVLGKDYGELMQCISINKLQPLKFMAWYYSTQPPWYMDAAVQTPGAPEQITGRIKSRIQKGGEVIIAHMWGPYDQVGKAYSKIEIWMKENNRKAGSAPFEVYLNDPAAVKSPSEIRTDVYQPLQ